MSVLVRDVLAVSAATRTPRPPGEAQFALAAHGELLLVDGGRPLDVPAGHGPDVVAAVELALHAAGPKALVCGLVPFDPAGRAEFLVTENAQRTPWVPDVPANPVVPSPVADDPGYRRNVAEALQHIGAGDVEKVVLARTVEHRRDVDVPAYFARLGAGNPHGWTFAVRTGGGVLTGASPELIARVDDEGFRSHPLAGSRPRRPGETAAPADLTASTKDRHEHGFVVDHIVRRMTAVATTLDVPSTPTPTATDRMWHLGTPITGTLRPGVSSLAAALRIHPTPAVAGTPVEAALELIRELEPVERGFYAGLVGWQDAAGHGEWALVLRCALLDDGTARLHAGAGVVAGSTPEAEHAETAAKFATALAALEQDAGETDS